MNTQEIIDIENKHTSGTYAKQPLVIVRGQGALLFDADGVEYLDCSSGHGVANLGHAHPKVAEAIYKQASTLITLFETFPERQARRANAENYFAGRWIGSGLSLQLRNRGRGSRIEIFPHLYRTKECSRRYAGFPWPDVWFTLRDFQQKISRRIRTACAGI